jgi:hypothetical protein
MGIHRLGHQSFLQDEQTCTPNPLPNGVFLYLQVTTKMYSMTLLVLG